MESQNVEALLSRARSLAATGQHADAQTVFDQLLETSPSHRAGLLGAAQSARASGDDDACLQYLRRAESAFDDDPRIATNVAQQLRRMGDTHGAFDQLERALERFPTVVELRIELAALTQQSGDSSRARELWRDAVELDPGSRVALAGAGGLEASLGDHEGALGWFMRALEVWPNDPGLTKNATLQLRALERFDEARALLDAALVEHGESIPLLTELARTQQAEGKTQPALETWQRLLTTDPNHRVALLGAGACMRTLDDPDSALVYLRRAVAAHPDDAVAATRLGQHLRLWDQTDEAIEWLRSVNERFPKSLEPRVELALAYQQSGDHESALKVLNAALRVDPSHRKSVLTAAALLTQVGRDSEALAVLERAEACGGPNIRQLAAQRCRILITMGDLDGASALVPRLDDGSPSAAIRLLDLIADVAAARWDLPTSEATFQLVSRLEPSPHRLERLATVRLVSSKVQEAWDAQEAWAIATRSSSTARNHDTVVRPHHGMIGDILNEVSLDREGAAQAQEAIRCRDVKLACENVRSRPGSHAAAIGLLVTLRRAGLMDSWSDAQGVPAERAIPEQVTQAWLGSPLPDDGRSLTNTWAVVNERWEHRVLDDRTARDFLGDAHGDRAVRAFRAARHPATKADLLRLAYLATHGGVWADIDDRPLANLGPLLKGRSLVLWQEHLGTVGNNFLAVVPGHAVIQDALDEAISNCIAGFSESTWLATGPGLLTRALARWLVEADHLDTLSRATVILQRHELRRYVAVHQPLAYKKTNLSWIRAAKLA